MSRRARRWEKVRSSSIPRQPELILARGAWAGSSRGLLRTNHSLQFSQASTSRAPVKTLRGFSPAQAAGTGGVDTVIGDDPLDKETMNASTSAAIPYRGYWFENSTIRRIMPRRRRMRCPISGNVNAGAWPIHPARRPQGPGRPTTTGSTWNIGLTGSSPGQGGKCGN